MLQTSQACNFSFAVDQSVFNQILTYAKNSFLLPDSLLNP
jgi:hypothetical protein